MKSKGLATIDATDVKILEILQRDGRIPMKQLAAMVCMSTPSTTERVHKLEDAGVITGYKAVVNPEAIGRSIIATVLVNFEPTEQAAFDRYIAASPDVQDYDTVTGKSSASIRIACKNMAHFQKLIHALHEFGATETYVVVES